MTTSPPEASPPATSGAYQVLARKYRPQSFDDLIGQEAMVRTLRNAFATGRIAHAFVFTGVRGVGKTTTARILARALNYVGPDGADNGPTIDMAEEGRHCRAIAESRHPDVLEMDAASRTGVGDVRELIEGVRYAPIEARYKVYIIDEVHMLSTAAFNALLKTLEEPPPHVKFAFATTEIRKLPVTVLSRCQRFDLRRVEPARLAKHLGDIAGREGVRVEPPALAMIARAAEGSVRDGLSILDQALIQHGRDTERPVSAEAVRDMLGLAGRTQVWTLLRAAFEGDAKLAVEEFRRQNAAGADPAAVIRDLLELTHLVTAVKAAGPAAADQGPAGEADAARAAETAEAAPMQALTRAWSLLMKGLGETQAAPDPSAAAEIAIIRLAYAADLPTPDEALRAWRDGAGPSASSPSAKPSAAPPSAPNAAPAPPSPPVASAFDEPRVDASDAPQPLPQPQPQPQQPRAASAKRRLRSFEDVARLAGADRDARLRVELETHARLVSFEQGRIELRLDDAAPSDLAGRLVRRLKEWTGETWAVTVNSAADGAPTLREARRARAMADPLVKAAFELFPTAELIAVHEDEPAEGDGDEEAPARRDQSGASA